MDKYEYKVRSEEINKLIEERKYTEAVKIADTIDWRRVKSVTMLCKVSELYRANRRYMDSKDVLLLAYDKQPNSRKILYSLCELSIKLEDVVPALEYYKAFINVAPRDTGRYILQYRLYELQDVNLEERIAVLEEYKKRDYREKWAYELAYLYHRIGLATQCVEECDELILWFGEGKYVIKAMELKMLHAPLTPSQQEKYDARFQPHLTVVSEAAGEEEVPAEQEEITEKQETGATTDTIPNMPIRIKSVEPSGAPTVRIPAKEEVEPGIQGDETDAYGMTGALSEEPIDEAEEQLRRAEALVDELNDPEKDTEDEEEIDRDNISIDVPFIPVAKVPEDLDIEVKPVDVGEYNTINLQKELAKNLAKILEKEDMEATDATRTLPVEVLQNLTEKGVLDPGNTAPASVLSEDEELLEEIAEEQEAPVPEVSVQEAEDLTDAPTTEEIFFVDSEDQDDETVANELLGKLAEVVSEMDTKEPVAVPGGESVAETKPIAVAAPVSEGIQPAVAEPETVVKSDPEATRRIPSVAAITKEEKEDLLAQPTKVINTDAVNAALEPEPIELAHTKVIDTSAIHAEMARQRASSLAMQETGPIADDAGEETLEALAEAALLQMEKPVDAAPVAEEPAIAEAPAMAEEEPEPEPVSTAPVAEKPVIAEEPAIAEAPAMTEEEPEPEPEPVSTAPVAEKPVFVEAPVIAEEPVIAETPVMAEEEPEPEPEPVSTAPVAEKPVFVEAPVIAEEPVIAEAPVMTETESEPEPEPVSTAPVAEVETEPVEEEPEVRRTPEIVPLPIFTPEPTDTEREKKAAMAAAKAAAERAARAAKEAESYAPQYNSTIMNTAEINGLEEKLLSSYDPVADVLTEEDTVEELTEIEETNTYEDPTPAPASVQEQKPVIGTTTEELETLVIQALAESEEKPADAPKGDTTFIIKDLVADEEKRLEEERLEQERQAEEELKTYEEKVLAGNDPMQSVATPNLLAAAEREKKEGLVIENIFEEEEPAEVSEPEQEPVAAPEPEPMDEKSKQQRAMELAVAAVAAKEAAKAKSEEKPEPPREARSLTREEKETFGSVAQTKEEQEKLAYAIDHVSIEPTSGNLLVIGEKGTGTENVAKNLVKVLSTRERRFSGRVAKITGELLNKKNIPETLASVLDGALIVEDAGALDDIALSNIGDYLKNLRAGGAFIALVGSKKEMEEMLARPNMPREFFDIELRIASLDNDGLVAYGKEYAREREYAIDEMGVLALYTKISERQTRDHAVTVEEVKELVDGAIAKAEKKNIGHFMDVVFAKRYDDQDMIVLKERDFQ